MRKNGRRQLAAPTTSKGRTMASRLTKLKVFVAASAVICVFALPQAGTAQANTVSTSSAACCRFHRPLPRSGSPRPSSTPPCPESGASRPRRSTARSCAGGCSARKAARSTCASCVPTAQGPTRQSRSSNASTSGRRRPANLLDQHPRESRGPDRNRPDEPDATKSASRPSPGPATASSSRRRSTARPSPPAAPKTAKRSSSAPKCSRPPRSKSSRDACSERTRSPAEPK